MLQNWLVWSYQMRKLKETEATFRMFWNSFEKIDDLILDDIKETSQVTD